MGKTFKEGSKSDPDYKQDMKKPMPKKGGKK